MCLYEIVYSKLVFFLLVRRSPPLTMILAKSRRVRGTELLCWTWLAVRQQLLSYNKYWIRILVLLWLFVTTCRTSTDYLGSRVDLVVVLLISGRKILYIWLIDWLKWRSSVQPSSSECPDVKNYNWGLNQVWYRMLYSCSHMTTVASQPWLSECPDVTNSKWRLLPYSCVLMF